MKKHLYLLITIAISGLLFTGCDYYIEGSGIIVTDTLDLEPFNGITLIGAENVEIFYGEEQEVLVTGDDNIVERIKTSVENGNLHIDLDPGPYCYYELKYYITVPRLNDLVNDGAAKVVVNDFINEGDLNVGIYGAGDIEFNHMENTKKLFITIDGAGNVVMKDEFPSLELLSIVIEGAGNFKGYPVTASNCDIYIEGAAKCEVSVEENLDVFIDGAGAVYYKGFPTITKQVSGLGKVVDRN